MTDMPPNGSLVDQDVVDLSIHLTKGPDGLFTAHLKTIAEDGSRWECDSNPRTTRHAAISQALWMADANYMVQ